MDFDDFESSSSNRNEVNDRSISPQEQTKRKQECHKSHSDLQNLLENLFDNHEITEWMIEELEANDDDDVKVVIHSNNDDTLMIPWQNEKIWTALDNKSLRKFFVGLDLSEEDFDENQIYDANNYTNNDSRILVILGSEKGANNKRINTNVDRKEFEELKKELEQINSSIYIQIEQPSPQELEVLLQEDWDIIYYGGHSITEEDDGKIDLKGGSISISKLKEYFKTLLKNQRLKLFIANSCDGIGIAKVLRRCGLPFALVMRESIPDSYAHKFLTYIIQSFLIGVPLSQTIRLSRPFFGMAFDQQYELPGASLLPLFSLNYRHINDLDLPIINLKGVNEQTLEMNALAEAAKSRLTVSNHEISELQLLQFYADYLRHKNIVEDPNDNNTYWINDWNLISSRIKEHKSQAHRDDKKERKLQADDTNKKEDKPQAHHNDKNVIWEIEFLADVDGQKLKWGAGFVNIKTGDSELLLDTRPSMWTGKPFIVNEEKLKWLKIGNNLDLPTEEYRPQEITFTTIALFLLDEEYKKYASSVDSCEAKEIKNFGGWLKDENRKKFQREFAILLWQNPNANEELKKELLRQSLSKIPFGLARESLSINQFTIDTDINSGKKQYPWKPLTEIIEKEKWDEKFCQKLIDKRVSKDHWSEILIPDKIIIRKATRAS
ncbi:adenylate cyclase (plasmid) [Geminocystis sp. NIES-3709]|nr:adenylate cyclase [Geminocystis sp. NIES-3709]